MKYINIFLSILLIITASISCRNQNPVESNKISDEYYLNDPSINISQPAYGENWKPGSSHEIRWSANSNIKNVKLELYKKGVHRYTISQTTDNNGSYLWKIPSDIIQSNHYQIKITSTLNKNLEGFSEVFYISN